MYGTIPSLTCLFNHAIQETDSNHNNIHCGKTKKPLNLNLSGIHLWIFQTPTFENAHPISVSGETKSIPDDFEPDPGLVISHLQVTRWQKSNHACWIWMEPYTWIRMKANDRVKILHINTSFGINGQKPNDISFVFAGVVYSFCQTQQMFCPRFN